MIFFLTMELINVLVDLDTRLRSATGVYRGQVICGCIGNSCNHFDLDLPSAIKEKQETYGTYCESADTGNIVQDILNLSDSVLEKLLELTDRIQKCSPSYEPSAGSITLCWSGFCMAG